MLHRHFLNEFEMVSVAPITTDITLIVTFHTCCVSTLRHYYYYYYTFYFLQIIQVTYYYNFQEIFLQ